MLGLNYLAWVGIVSWIVVPLLALFITALLWRYSHTVPGKGLALVAGVAILSVPALIANGIKSHYDQQVRELCAKDGGVRVYETVRLPTEKFNQWGQVNFYRPDQGENALGSEYVLRTDVQYFRRGNISLRRYHVQVIRHRDGLLLGESVGYDRGGGDLPGPWQPSSFSCPKHHGETVIDSIFISNQGVQK
ncbi:hypothetical protein [Thiobacillus sp. 65-1402]|uniref:hypothetical protein n=1 Tax=Thiobacillus sp. 65-1402 TaxID=1895861 RepID=UPI00086C7A91|nr:hypothetical protein [Thiobacillus sp. 65-1402]ODU05318.1 MAG: hypothetical protein ABS89_02020 [Thiobacillus sp. SCN 63-1177]OJW83904.1 MAG: hypothetical protein BGO62_08230 [Thiobacillus sp. 65-1402]